MARRRKPAEYRQRPEGNIFIYCDSPTHGRRSAVTNFYPDDETPGRWAERYAASPGAFLRDQLQTLADDAPIGEISLDPRELANRDIRRRYRLTCRRCGDRSTVVVVEANLFTALDRLAEAGVSEVSLSAIAASIKSISA